MRTSLSRNCVQFCCLTVLFVAGGGAPAMAQVRLRPEHYQYKEIDLEEMVRRYISKNPDPGSIEGIYSVSCVVIKKGRSFLGGIEKERTVNRKDNYAKVAILKDWPGSSTEYVEVSLNDSNAPKYPIVAEITSLSDGRGFLFNHFEPRGNHMTFTFTPDGLPDILNGAYSFSEKRAVITYKLSYLRTYPKTGEGNVSRY